jgi:hypothetical protein
MPIDRLYGSTFYRPPPNSDETFGPSFHWTSPRRGPLIVFHPELLFDPWSADTREIEILARKTESDWPMDSEAGSTSPYIPPDADEIQILHESFQLKGRITDAIQAFIEIYPTFQRMNSDEIPWYNTGFWSARVGQENHIGVSESALSHSLFPPHHHDFVYVLSNYSTIVELGSKNDPKSTTVDVYLNNRSLPWAEMRRAVLSTLNGIGPWNPIGKEFINKGHLARDIPRRRRIIDRPQRTKTSHLEPLAISKMMRNVYHSAIVEWRFGPVPWPQFNHMRYVLASIGPYLELQDITPEANFQVQSFYPYFLSHCIVVDCTLRKSRDRSTSPTLIENLFRE